MGYSDQREELERQERDKRARAVRAEKVNLPLSKGKPIPSYFPFLPLQRLKIVTIIQHQLFHNSRKS